MEPMESTNKITCDVFPVICEKAGAIPEKLYTRRNPEASRMRMLGIYIQRFCRWKGPSEIGRLYSLDHSTITRHCNQFEALLLKNDEFSKFAKECINMFRGQKKYVMSRDYDLLYKMLCAGMEVPCYVDYDSHRDGVFIREFCKAKRLSEYYIYIGTRGLQHGGIDSGRDYKDPEIDLLTAECKRMNLEFILP